jgi:pimeloyl-ACP methyl ester carboxylesterase
MDIIHKIAVPTLLLNGRYDEAQDEVMEPFFRYIPKVKWVRFAESAHVPQFEEKELFIQVVAGFLDY